MTILMLAIVLAAPQDSKPNEAPALEEVFKFTERGVVGLDFAPAGGALAVGGDGYVGRVDLQTFKLVKHVGQKGLVDEVIFDPSGLKLISRSKSPGTVLRSPGDLKPIEFAVDRPDWQELVDPKAPLFPDQDPNEAPPQEGDCPAAFSRDGRRLALVNGARGFSVWGLDAPPGMKGQMIVRELNFESLPTRRPRGTAEGNFRRTRGIPHVNLGHATALCYEGDHLWVGMENGFLLPVEPYWFSWLGEPEQAAAPPPLATTPIEYQTPKAARVFRPHGGDVTSIVFLDEGRTLMTAGREGLVAFWNAQEVLDRKPPVKDQHQIREPKPVKVLKGHFACASPDGKVIAVAEKNGVRCYDRESFAVLSWTPTDSKLGRPARVKFSPDGSMLAATMCACATCSKADVLYSQAAFPKMRSHHHGGTLIVWTTAPK